MQALSVIGATSINPSIAPKTVKTGGTSKTDPNAGSGTNTSPTIEQAKISTKDRAGAGILTVLAILIIIGGSLWIIL
jgi:hypothetical protein